MKCKVNPGRQVIRAGDDGGRIVLDAGSVFETDSADAADMANNGTVSIVSDPVAPKPEAPKPLGMPKK